MLPYLLIITGTAMKNQFVFFMEYSNIVLFKLLLFGTPKGTVCW